MFDKPIGAIATAPGKGGVAIIRISGENVLSVAEKMFTPKGKTPVACFEPYKMYTGTIDGGEFNDYGICVYFKAPKSYTGEDVVEFHCHGGESMARGILKKTYSLGVKPAGKGEFTKRAFLNGKLSLASAEGVADMINGESEAELRAGYFLYSEKLTLKIKDIQNVLKEVLAGIDASVDYPEEGIEEDTSDEIYQKLLKIYSDLCTMTKTYSSGKKIKSGVTVAICGKPNTGKSSLLNKLLGFDKAIVSDIAGTTRDAVEGSIEIHGTKFNLYDTAGLHECADKLENIGIDKAESIIKTADVVVFVCDSVTGIEEEDKRVLEKIDGKNTITVLNKVDKNQTVQSVIPDVMTSAVNGNGIDKLKELLYEKSMGERSEDMAFVVEERHYNALEKARKVLENAINDFGSIPLDLIGISVTECWQSLGEITGETASEKIVDEIFSKFCVGK